MRILLVEDDKMLADGLVRSLQYSGYSVDHVASGTEAELWLKSQEYDAAILDLGLPGLDGADILQRLRARKSHVPVLILSAREALEERVRLLNLGADDYLIKPAAYSELEARLRTLLRRHRMRRENELEIGALRLDTVGKRAWIQGEQIDLSAREWAVLEFLAERLGHIVSKEQLLQAMYGWDDEVTPNAVEKFVSRLRTRLEDSDVHIRTVRGLGYLLEQK